MGLHRHALEGLHVANDGNVETPPSEWRVCSVSVDQGGDGWGAGWYLMMKMQCGLVLMKDPAHRCGSPQVVLQHIAVVLHGRR